MSTDELDVAFAQSGSAPPSVPIGLCRGELLALLPSLWKAVINHHQSENSALLEEAYETLVGKNTLLLSLLGEVWTGNLVQQLDCNGERRFIAFHTFAKIPLAVAEWLITRISEVSKSSISGKSKQPFQLPWIKTASVSQ